MDYSKELHYLHSEYPFAPERICVKDVEKLVPKFNDKTKFVLHYSNLNLLRD